MNAVLTPRLLTSLFFFAGTLSAVGCAVRSGQGAQSAPPTASHSNLEVYAARAPRQAAQAPLFLPGMSQQTVVKYEVVGNQAVMEGDILLGAPATLFSRYGLPSFQQTGVHSAVARTDKRYLWNNGEIPYEIDRSIDSAMRKNIEWAINHLATTSIKVRPRQSSDTDYVYFQNSGAGCSSYIGRIGGKQEIELDGCGAGSVVHELLHAAGFYHEQSRSDRDSFITIVWDQIGSNASYNFEKRDSLGQDIGSYDYGSLMHYGDTAFSRTGAKTIIPKQSGVVIGQREALSAGDRSAIAQLYGGSATTTPTLPTTPQVPVVPQVPTTPTQPTQPTTVAGGNASTNPWGVLGTLFPGLGGQTQTPTGTTPATGGGTTAATGAGFGGNYSSERGAVSCTQNGSGVSCTYPGGSLLCSSSNGVNLECGWSGSGQGRASFVRQADGSLQGSYGDWMSNNSRGAWNLTPGGAGTTQTPSVPQGATTQPSTPQSGGSLAGAYQSSRGALQCSDTANGMSCTFTGGASGRMDCSKDQSGLRLSCTWGTVSPSFGSGRASFSRGDSNSRTFTGTYGYLTADQGAGSWDLQGQ